MNWIKIIDFSFSIAGGLAVAFIAFCVGMWVERARAMAMLDREIDLIRDAFEQPGGEITEHSAATEIAVIKRCKELL